MTEEELHDLVAGNQQLSADERHIVGEVFDAGKRQIREVLVPRTEVEFLPADMPLSRAVKIVREEPYSRFPVYQESFDDVIGFIHVRDLLDPEFTSRPLTVGEIARPVKRLPISKTVLSALSEMRSDRAHLAIVMDEYGGTAGIVTLEDLVEELVGEIQDEYDVDEGQPTQLQGDEMEVDGLLNLDEFAEQTGIELPEGPYETVAGFILAMLGHLPTEGEAVEVAGRILTVVQMDGRRIARVRVSPLPRSSEDAGRQPAQSPHAGSGPQPPGRPSATGQPADGQPAAGQPADGQQADGQQADGQPADGQPADGRPADGQPADRERADSGRPAGQRPDA
jgi:putative hemolysin